MKIKPLAPEEWPSQMNAGLAALAPANGALVNQSPATRRPGAGNVLGTMAHHPVLAQAFFTFNGHLLNTNSLSARQRELLVLRVASVKNCGYEWAQHLLIGQDAGLTEREIASVAYGPDSPLWSRLDSALVRSVDEFIADGGLSDATWTALSEYLEPAQILDSLYTIGCYVTLAAVIQTLGIELEDDIREILHLRFRCAYDR